MRTRTNWPTFAAMVAASFLGGAAYQGLLGAPQAAFAQQPPAPEPKPAQAVVRARSFVLVDKDGIERARLGSVPGGGTGLVLLDKEGRPRAALGCTADGSVAGLTLMDADGKDQAVLGADEKQGVALHLAGQEDGAKLLLTAAGDGKAASLSIVGAEGKEVAGLHTGATGTGLGLSGPDGDERVTLKLGLDGAPTLRVVDADGKEKWHAP